MTIQQLFEQRAKLTEIRNQLKDTKRAMFWAGVQQGVDTVAASVKLDDVLSEIWYQRQAVNALIEEALDNETDDERAARFAESETVTA